MTIDEAKEVIEQDIPCEHDPDLIEALNMAIASLEAWGKVKAEIEDYKEKYIKLHRDWDATMMQGYDDALMVIDKHLQEVTE